ncbi:MAG TPA: DoxX family membrane protein [Gemmatimonadaceae bacterium]|nr:DoxX family membrane protein [Gemmatimonadaceae bacterium]
MPPRTSVSDSMRFPQRWIVLLRVVVGLWFLQSLLTKFTIALAWGFLPVPAANARWMRVMPKLLAKYAADNPIHGYQHFLQHTVIPNSHLFASFTAVGEVGVGLCLTLGLLTVPASFVGAIQVVFYGMAVQHMSPGQRGFHVMLFAMMTTFFFTGAGRYWGIDGWLRSRYPDSVFARWPLS